MKIIPFNTLEFKHGGGWEHRARDTYDLYASIEVGEKLKIANEEWYVTGRRGHPSDYRAFIKRWFPERKYKFIIGNGITLVERIK